MKHGILFLLLGLQGALLAQPASRWAITPDGQAISWAVASGSTHMDHVEMSGLQISAIVHYGVEDGRHRQRVQLVFPMLRTLPNDTHASLIHEFDQADWPTLLVNGRPLRREVESWTFSGILTAHLAPREGIRVQESCWPSTSHPAFFDQISLENRSDRPVSITLPVIAIRDTTPADQGVQGAYVIEVSSTHSGQFILAPGQRLVYARVYSARPIHEPARNYSAAYEQQKRQQLIDQTCQELVLDTPDEEIDHLFSFSKLRAVESIYDTRGGLMHGPGGGRYYAAIWANDQAEYANPFFPFLGNAEGIESAINSFRHFARYMNDDFHPIPSSIIAEGTDFWNGARDRGDMAMIAYGATRFALAYGDGQTAEELWPLISWCLEYCRRKVNADGVVASDCDELENRFPAGQANLHTSCLYYDALLSAAMLGRDLQKDSVLLETYHRQALSIRAAIEQYFGANIQGYDTYRYYKENKVLRAWICSPLTVDVNDRATATIDALFSPDLWTEDGLATEAGKPTFWDRATLYALRGVLAAGETARAMPFLSHYANRRLLGDHVPYPVEAWPEGNQRHLSAESALFCRVITEGLWGIRPTGLHSFTCTPRLPEDWDHMAFQQVHLQGKTLDLEVHRQDKDLHLIIRADGLVQYNQKHPEGKPFHIEHEGLVHTPSGSDPGSE